MTDIGATLARIEKRLAAVERASRLSSAAIDNAALEVRDADGSLRALVGQQADGTTAVNVTNGPTPPTPSDPTIEPALAALTVTWDGTFTDTQAAPLDWMRVEVHIGPTADFTTDQGTLRDTIETTQGGSVVVPLPYTEWFVKLRSRTTSGTAGPDSNAVAGTPRKADTEDLVVGAITADLIAVDALTGKTITGGTITGATVTGGTVQTATSGKRLTLNPNSADPLTAAAAPGFEIHSGYASEVTPGVLTARLESGIRPYVALASPAVATEGVDTTILPINSILLLASSDPGVRGGSFTLDANPNPYNDYVGKASLYGVVGKDTFDTSILRLTCFDGDDAPGGSGTLGPGTTIEMTGSSTRLRAQNSTADFSAYVTPAGLTGPYGTYSEEGTWQAVTFTGWKQSTNGTYQTMRCARGAKRARLDGCAMVSTAIAAGGTQNVCTLPSGMWPLKAHYYDIPWVTGGSPSLLGCRVGSDGVVTIWSSTARAINDLFDFTECNWPLD